MCRSHSILCLTVTQKDDLSGRSKRSKLFLVDLAGSEKVSDVYVVSFPTCVCTSCLHTFLVENVYQVHV
jgi:hypothetical protein